MTKIEYLLQCLSEECAEVIQACSKANRFGLDSTYRGPSNLELLNGEISDLLGVIEILKEYGIDINSNDIEAINLKKEKVQRFMEYSKNIGILTE